MALSTLMVFSFNTTETKKYIIAEVQENSKIIRHNKHITTRDNKLKRFRELAAKKRLTKEEQAEAVKLQTYLEREVRKERKCPTTQTP